MYVLHPVPGYLFDERQYLSATFLSLVIEIFSPNRNPSHRMK